MNSIIVCTGGTKGIGRAVIEKFMANGFDAITCSRHEDDLAGMKQALENKYGTKLHTLQADLSSKEETLRFISFVQDHAEAVDVLVNNTGVFLPGEIINEEDGALETMIETNLYSAYRLTRGVIHEMIEAGAGYVFNICSIASIQPYANGGSYSISKYAMHGMTKVLREELKEKNIKVTSVLPGATLTASWEGVDLPEERFIKPTDVADSIWSVFSLSGNTCVEELLIRPQLGDI